MQPESAALPRRTLPRRTLGSARATQQLRSSALLLLLHACAAPATARSAPSEPPLCPPTALACRWECIRGRSDPGCYTVATMVRPAAPVTGITLVTQTTRSKVRYLERALETWGGPASITFYAYSSEELAFFSNYTCADCTIAVVYGGLLQQAYPINLLRNVALVAAPTNLAFIFDTDFLPSPGLHDALAAHVAESGGTERMAWVVPAFEINEDALDVPADFQALCRALKAGAVGVFHGNRGGHHNTQVPRWLNTSTQYCLKRTTHNYEPYVVIDKTEPDFPLFDPKFVDRGLNKVMWAQALKALGYRLCVVPRAWVVHVYERRPRYRPFYAKGRGGKVVKIMHRHQMTGSSIRLQLPGAQSPASQPQLE